jgi:hypothetical protein
MPLGPETIGKNNIWFTQVYSQQNGQRLRSNFDIELEGKMKMWNQTHLDSKDYSECHNPECHILFIVMPNVIMLNVVKLNVAAPINKRAKNTKIDVFFNWLDTKRSWIHEIGLIYVIAGLYYKTFYNCNCCRTVISKIAINLNHRLMFGDKAKSQPIEWSLIIVSTLVGSSPVCK